MNLQNKRWGEGLGRGMHKYNFMQNGKGRNSFRMSQMSQMSHIECFLGVIYLIVMNINKLSVFTQRIQNPTIRLKTNK